MRDNLFEPYDQFTSDEDASDPHADLINEVTRAMLQSEGRNLQRDDPAFGAMHRRVSAIDRLFRDAAAWHTHVHELDRAARRQLVSNISTQAWDLGHEPGMSLSVADAIVSEMSIGYENRLGYEPVPTVVLKTYAQTLAREGIYAGMSPDVDRGQFDREIYDSLVENYTILNDILSA